jgi:hypothetical protein
MHESFQGSPSDDSLRHPAAEAWRRLRPHSTVPTRVELIGDTRSLERKIEIFRLTIDGGEPNGLAVIAKRSSMGSGLAEHRSYEILAHRSVPCLKCYGCVSDGDDGCWLFLEDAGGEVFDSTSDRHRSSAYDWIARMHVETARGREPHPRGRGVDYYSQVCSTSRNHLLSALHGGAFEAEEAEDTQTLSRLVAALGELEVQWGHVRLACDRVPQSLTHNALLARNLRVREHRGEFDFVAFDWERSGWGPPALDIARLVGWAPEQGAHEYWRRVRSAWAGVSVADVERLVVSGSLFKLIQSIAWEASYVERDWYRRPLGTLKIYGQRLERGLAALAAWT